MTNRAEPDERLLAEVLGGADRNLSVPPFSLVRQRGSQRRGLFVWATRLAAAGALAGVAVVLAGGLMAMRARPVSSEVATQAAALAPAAQCRDHATEVTTRWGSVQGVAGAFIVSATDLAAWQETRNADRGARPESEFRSRGAEPMLVCFFDGTFDGFPGAGKRPLADRIVVIVDANGTLTLDSAGPQADLKVERPGPRP